MNKESFKLTSGLKEIIATSILSSSLSMNAATAFDSIWLYVNNIIGAFV